MQVERINLNAQAASVSHSFCKISSTAPTDISALNMQQNRLKDETATLQEASAELKETLAVRYRQQEELSTQRKALSMQIVSSPEKFRKQIVEV